MKELKRTNKEQKFLTRNREFCIIRLQEQMFAKYAETCMCEACLWIVLDGFEKKYTIFGYSEIFKKHKQVHINKYICASTNQFRDFNRRIK